MPPPHLVLCFSLLPFHFSWITWKFSWEGYCSEVVSPFISLSTRLFFNLFTLVVPLYPQMVYFIFFSFLSFSCSFSLEICTSLATSNQAIQSLLVYLKFSPAKIHSPHLFCLALYRCFWTKAGIRHIICQNITRTLGHILIFFIFETSWARPHN